MTVGEWIAGTPGTVITVAPDACLDEIIDRLLAEPCLRDVHVLSEDGRVIGHLSHRRLVRLALVEHRPGHTRRQLLDRVSCGCARELMDVDFVCAHPNERLDEVLHRQIEQDVEDMPVIDDSGRLLGAVNITAVLRSVCRGELDP